ncbi:MAG: hypothetical protein HYR96_08590 [Deltaproteobacteria bacterium]|nr:hypothetical protein [Deltaproteobacteria bacterium]MBI3294669.1 hypothetical protein [Deltaproteobacteria bacterium]
MKLLIFLMVGPWAWASINLSCPEAFLIENRVNEASRLPPRVKLDLFELFPMEHIDAMHLGAFTDIGVSSQFAPITSDTMLFAYRNGWKLYHHFDVEGTMPEWQMPAYRGIHNFARTRELARTSSAFKQTKKLFFNKKGEPQYDVRINYEQERIVRYVASAEHSAQDTMSKTFLTGENGRQFRWNRTWLSPEIQGAFIELISRGHGYTIGVYTNANHPFHEPDAPNGKLVGAAFGIEAGGGFTSISTGMDRTPIEPGGNKLRYDGAGKIADFTEIDYIQSLGRDWLDSVTVNALPRAFGAYFITRAEHHELLRRARENPVRILSPSGSYRINFDAWLK